MTNGKTMEHSIIKWIGHMFLWSWNFFSRMLEGIFEIQVKQGTQECGDSVVSLVGVDASSVTCIEEPIGVVADSNKTTTVVQMPGSDREKLSLEDISDDRKCTRPTVAASVIDTESKASEGRATLCPSPQMVQETIIVKPAPKKQRKRKAKLEKIQPENIPDQPKKFEKGKDKSTLHTPADSSKVILDSTNKRYFANSALRKLKNRSSAVNPGPTGEVIYGIRPIRQPLGPTVGSIGFSKEYQESRRAHV